jgi:hypothetical protein
VTAKRPPHLDPDAPGLDDMTRRRRRALEKMQLLSTPKLLELAVKAGIYTPQGQLEQPYRDDAEPSASRPSD